MAAMSSASPMSMSESCRALLPPRPSHLRFCWYHQTYSENMRVAQLGVAEGVRQDVEEAAERVGLDDHAADADHGHVQALFLGDGLDVGREAQALVVDEVVHDRR